MCKRFIILFMLSFLIVSCQAKPNNQYRDLTSSHLLFPFDEDRFLPIDGVSWTHQNTLAVQGMSPQSGRWPIYIADVAEGSLHPIVNQGHAVSAYTPVISPNGKYLAFLSDSAVSESGVRIFELSSIIDNNYVLPEESINVDVEGYVRLAWSPDSTQLAMLGFKSRSSNVLALYLYTVSDGSLEPISEYSEENIDSRTRLHFGEIEYDLSWSPDGQRLAFSLAYERDDQEQFDLFVYHFEENRFVRLTTTPEINEKYPSWYPKDDVLVFVSMPTSSSLGINNGKLVFVTRDGSCTKTLSKLEGISSPSWSPDGTQIAYISDDGLEIIDVVKTIPLDFLSAKSLCNPAN